MMPKSVIEAYSRMSKEYPPWTAEEERKFVDSCTTRSGKWKSNAMKERFVDEATKRNISLVFSIVNQFAFNVQSDDIMQLAMISLVEALKKWDPGRRVKISTWVRNPIKWAILRAQGTYSKNCSISEEISARNHRFGCGWSVVSVDAEVPGHGSDDGSETFASIISEGNMAPDYRIMRGEVRTCSDELHDDEVRLGVEHLMRKMGEFLSKREMDVIRGILKGKNLAEIGVKMKLSRMRISQISREAFDKIRRSPIGRSLRSLISEKGEGK